MMIKKYTIEIKWALIFIVTGFLWMLFEKSLGLHSTHIASHAKYTKLFALPALIIYAWALLDKRKVYYQGHISYKQAFISGLIITAFVTLLTPLTQWINNTVISPGYFQNIINYTVSTGEMSQAEAVAYFSRGNFLLKSIIFTPLMGLITSAVVALFIKKS